MAEVSLSSLRQNNLTKTIVQINDYLFIYMKFKPLDHTLQHVPHFGGVHMSRASPAHKDSP